MRLKHKGAGILLAFLLSVVVALPAAPAWADYSGGWTDCLPWYVRVNATTQGSTSVSWSGLSTPVSYYNPSMDTDYHYTGKHTVSWWVDASNIGGVSTSCLP